MKQGKFKVWVVEEYKKDRDRYLRFIIESNVDLVYSSEPWEYREYLKPYGVEVLPLPRNYYNLDVLERTAKFNNPSQVIGFILTNEEADAVGLTECVSLL